MNARRAAWAGVLGTVAMTLLFFLEPLLGLPKMSEGGILSTVMSATVAHFPGGIRRGVDRPLSGGNRAGPASTRRWRPTGLPGAPALRGALYGAVVFLGAQLVVMPLVGAGIFSSGDPGRLLGSLAGHLVYGGVVGWYYGRGVTA